MLKLLAAGATALFVTLSPTAFAQAPSAMGPARLGQADLAKLTDERIAIVKSVLQLTPDQEKYWPAVADAIRVRAQNRDARLTRIAETVGKMSDESASDVLRNRDPVAFFGSKGGRLGSTSSGSKETCGRVAASLPDTQPRTKAAVGGPYDLCAASSGQCAGTAHAV
jgi:hypothetical protein